MRGEVQEVAETRTNIARLAEHRGVRNERSGKDGLLALYGMLRAHAQAWVKKKVLKRSGAGRGRRQTWRGLLIESSSHR